MLSVFNECNGVSPVAQDFIWLGEYFDGTCLAEFDLQTKKENSFYHIKRDKLIRFGLIGHGLKLFFESDGVFNLNGTGIEVVYKYGDKEYPLTGHSGQYSDIISYKDAESTVNLAGGGVANTTINQYNFGYKTVLKMDGTTFQFKALCKVPYGHPMFMHFWLVADKKLNGVLQIKKNNRIVEELQAPLRKGVGGEVKFGLS
ncbi:hypothetical protein SECTIM467_49 [Brevibacillus phage SecTim467]|uniref:Uncharacterized protein n=2 Tax=Jenstvirus jenst TaxID=1982225 RepID=A0A0K2CP89_9CAUD|nr:hypothetical protein AVV11_gp142 [Brevibacillus phage Jenst]ALA07179.1 hypothetical protein JENST_49 [Brevibacillus phage Jenst]ALA07548.1 hypothetical protein SECTIM467_49 [Brevibacillus phage SecTim467]